MADGAKAPDASLPTLDRTTYLGGSDIGAVAGLSPYRTELDVWGAKVMGVEQTASPEMEAGTALEDGIVSLYLKRRGGDASILGTLRDPAEPWIGATPDRLVERSGLRRNVQVKLVGLHGAGRWGDPEEGPDGVPADVLAQVAWEAHALAANGLPVSVSDVVALVGTDLRVYEVPTDEEFFDALRTIARAFWAGHVLTRRPPEITVASAESARDVLSRLWPKQRRPLVEATPGLEQLARDYAAARDAVSAAEAKQKLAAARLQLAIGDAAGFESPGGRVRATWICNATGGTDWKAVAAELGATEAVAAKHQRPGARVLRVTVKED